MIRSFLALGAAATLVSACTVDGVNPFEQHSDTRAAATAMSTPGTCFAYVTTEEDGTYTLLTGIGNGTTPAQGVPKRGLSAQAVDIAVVKETEIMKINPECLATYVSPREIPKA